jgi:hypothetical protein
VLGRLLLGRAFNLLELRLMTTLPVAPPLAQPISAAEFMATAPPAMDGSSPWAQRYAAEIRRAWYAEAEQAPRTLQQHLGPSELGVECFSGDTEVVTRNGIRRIDALAVEGSAELLVPMLYEGSDVRKKWGQFVRVPVVYLGDQHTYTLTLRRGKERKVVRTTAGHRWFRSFYSGKRKAQEVVVTRELLAGHRLTQLRRAMPRSSSLMPWAVAQGFVFGDGTSGSNDARHRPAVLDLHHNGKDEALLPFFPGDWPVHHREGHTYPYTRIRGLPRFWKDLPPIDESASFLMSWLAGYFAADGCVTEDGHCSISSADDAHLEFVRDLAAVCGIGYGQVQKNVRLGINQDAETPLYRLSLRRRDLPDWFFLTTNHAARAAAANRAVERDSHWIVESVEPTGIIEPVYCAEVEGVGAFGLADDLMTGNCDRQVAGKIAALPTTNHVVDPWPSLRGRALHAHAESVFSLDNLRVGFERWLTERRVTPHPDHPGTADLYDAQEEAVVDHKFLGESSMAKIRRDPPRKYRRQLLLYGLGYFLEGFRVRRTVIAAYPATAGSLSGLYVWEQQFADALPDGSLRPTTAVLTEIAETFDDTARRKAQAAEIIAGRWRLDDVPAVPDSDECYFCPFYRPQAARDGAYGCSGVVTS